MSSYRYQDVYSDIKKSIETNHYRAGKLLPTQEELATKYNVSRVTIKKALNCLEKENLIYTKQGSGTFVKPRLNFPDNETLPLDYPVGVTYSHRDAVIKNKILHFNARLPHEEEKINWIFKILIQSMILKEFVLLMIQFIVWNILSFQPQLLQLMLKSLMALFMIILENKG